MNQEAKKEYKGHFCCFALNAMINEGDDPLYNVKYDSKTREYFLKSLEGPYIRSFEYCPWCGYHFSKNLSDEWFSVIRHELHLNPWDPDDRVKIPEEFLTEEWWKKRGL